jgi:hypothetical protein
MSAVDSSSIASGLNTYSAITEKAIPARPTEHVAPASQPSSPDAAGKHLGRRATMIMLHPQVKSQRTHNVPAMRTAA